MKKILVIEVDGHIDADDRHRTIGNFMDKFDGEYTIITNASQKFHEIKEILPTVDGLAFETVFTDNSYYMVKPMFELLAKIEKPLDIYIGYYDDVLNKISSILKNEKPKEKSYHFVDNPVNVVDQYFHSIKHHNLFKIEGRYGESIINPIDYSEYVDAYQNRIDKELEYRAERKESTTGIQVKINDLSQAPKIAKNVLSTGDIVDVIDCSKIDPRPTRGVWVWGDDEPVKLLNEGRYNEFEYVNQQDVNIVELIIRSTDLCYRDVTQTEVLIIKGILAEGEDEGNLICEELGIQKRNNRSTIKGIVSKWKENSQLV